MKTIKILLTLLQYIGIFIFISLPVILTAIICSVCSKYVISGFNPLFRHFTSLVLLLIMIIFSVIYSVYRHSMGQIKSLKRIIEKPGMIAAYVFAMAIFILLAFSQQTSIPLGLLIAIIIFITVFYLLGFMYMRGPEDFESEYLLELWASTIISAAFVVYTWSLI